ncbi:RNA-binding protein [Boeremia exigua]|uniref:RNA-binding protein n=1 Tax=Boeremia exigua TaxID=749465 RepID=UPI001E8D4867|nr:RNA-binding protein [Boeremia exigua]KAH6633652.1 RNA-binding protein [Boeremia exigua]
MSDTDMSSAEEVVKVVVKEKKEKKDKSAKKAKKDKKEKKSSKSKVEIGSDSDNEAAETPAKKRKREALPDEIVVDVGLPEPASKKAARAAKKAKLNPKPAGAGDNSSADATTDGAVGEAKKGEEKRSEFGVWVGNLPWSATKDSLRSFIMENSEIKTEQITRVHMPPSTKPVPAHWTTKPNNKGFAYVDFSTELAMYACIALTETKMDGRALLIKNAKSFEGRPDKPKAEVEESGSGGRGKVVGKPGGHPPNKRVFVGNLSFDVAKEDLEAHYAPCGSVENIHMATFEDSGKCKGYAWVTFGDVEAATCAVQGFVMKTEADVKAMKKKNTEGSDDEETEVKNPTKRRKWLLNKLNGREMRCEFAEDSTTRYNKRYGKDKPAAPVDGVNPDRWKNFGGDGDRAGGRREPREPRAPRPPKNGPNSVQPGKKVDPRSIKSGSAHMNAQRASQAIVEGQGKKTTF